NNHHIIIYKDENGVLKDDIKSFWEVVERQKQGEEIYQLPKEDIKGQIIFTLQENDIFILGISKEAFVENSNDMAFLTKYLYRVQKISKMNIMFRHHLASTLNEKEQEIHVQSIGRLDEL